MAIPNDFLGGTKQTNAPLYATLQAVKTAFKNRFMWPHFPLVVNDDPRGSYKADANTDKIPFPFAYWQMTSLELVKTAQNVKTLKRAGSDRLGSGDSNTLYYMAYTFPCRIECNLVYETNDPLDNLAFLERFAILIGTESLNVKVFIPIGQGLPFTTRIYSDSPVVNFNPSVIEDEANPGIFRNEFTFSVDGRIGTHKGVPKFNNEGEITYNMEIDL